MRKHALLLIVFAVSMTLASASWAQESRMLVGKYVPWETWVENSHPESLTDPSTASSDLERPDETPNQARRRLGLAPGASLPDRQDPSPTSSDLTHPNRPQETI
jgi:hypothetical protein